MREISKHIAAIIGIASSFYCFYFQFTIPSYCQTAPTNDAKAVVKTRTKEDEKVTDKGTERTKVLIKNKSSHKNKSTTEAQRPEWWTSCNKAAVLVATGKVARGEKMLAALVPQAREDVPDSLDLGITLARYGIALLADKKYDLAVTTLTEAAKIIHEKQSSDRQQTAMFQTLGAEGAALLQIHKFDKAELPIRKAIAYAIAFPNILKHGNLKKCYVLLRLSLEGQNKQDEASVIADILTGF